MCVLLVSTQAVVCEQRSTQADTSTKEEKTPLLNITTSRFRIENLCCEMEVGLVCSLLEPLEGMVDVKVRVYIGDDGEDELE